MQFKTENSRPKFLTMALLWSDGCYFCMGVCVHAVLDQNGNKQSLDG